jgi:hypothetical protein
LNAVIRIELTAEHTPENQMRWRFSNFAEDVQRVMWGICTVDLAELGGPDDHFVVRDIRRRDIGMVTTLIKRAIRHNRMLDDVQLVRVDLQKAADDPATAPVIQDER